MPPSPRRCSALRAGSSVLWVPMPLDPLVPSVGSRHRRVSFLPYTFMRECRLRGRGSNPNRGIVFVDVPPRNFSKRIPVESPKDSCTGRSDRTKNRRNDDPLRRRTRKYIQQVDDTKLRSRSHPGVVELHSGSAAGIGPSGTGCRLNPPPKLMINALRALPRAGEPVLRCMPSSRPARVGNRRPVRSERRPQRQGCLRQPLRTAAWPVADRPPFQ